MKRIAVVLILALSGILLPTSAHADGQLAVPRPNWWNERTVENIRYGQWLPCSQQWKIIDDCIDGVRISSLTGGYQGNLTYQPLEGFDPATAEQAWGKIVNSDGTTYDNYPKFVNLPGSQSRWKLPADLGLTAEASLVTVEVAMGQSGLRVLIHAANFDSFQLPPGYAFEVALKSSALSSKTTWIYSDVRNPQVAISGNSITIKGQPEIAQFAAINSTEDLCQPNQAKAELSRRQMSVSVMTNSRSKIAGANKSGEPIGTNPGDIILGTNGTACLSDFRWDPKLRQIIVQVGSVHFDVDGKVIDGWLELKVSGNRARTWWGLNPEEAAGYAKVEITYQDGTKKIATVASQYDKKNDWINLRAYGFTYSQPTLAISFKKPATQTKPTTITCVKGKATKKVTGANPKCPSGFTKK